MADMDPMVKPQKFGNISLRTTQESVLFTLALGYTHPG